MVYIRRLCLVYFRAVNDRTEEVDACPLAYMRREMVGWAFEGGMHEELRWAGKEGG